MSTRRTATRTATRSSPQKFQKKIHQSMQNVISKIWDYNCPFASIYVWILVAAGLYFFFMPSRSLQVHDNGTKITARSVDQKMRAYLLIATAVSGFLGYIFIKSGCSKVGARYSFLWFMIALVLAYFFAQLFLASTDNVSISDAGNILQQLFGTK
jgi:hypothetical protein